MAGFINPLTQSLQDTPLVPETPQVNPHTAGLLTPQTGSVLQPLLEYQLGNQQRMAEAERQVQQQKAFLSNQLEALQRRKAGLEWWDKQMKSPNAEHAKWLTENYGDAREAIRTGAIDPFTDIAPKFQAYFGGRSAKQKNVRAITSVIRNTVGWDAYNGDSYNWDNLDPETARQVANQILAFNQKLASGGTILKKDGKFFRVNRKGNLIPMAKVPDSLKHKVKDYNAIVSGLRANLDTLTTASSGADVVAIGATPTNFETLREGIINPEKKQQLYAVTDQLLGKWVKDHGIDEKQVEKDIPDIKARLIQEVIDGEGDITLNKLVDKIMNDKYETTLKQNLVGKADIATVAKPNADEVATDTGNFKWYSPEGKKEIIADIAAEYGGGTDAYRKAEETFKRMARDPALRNKILDSINAKAIEQRRNEKSTPKAIWDFISNLMG